MTVATRDQATAAVLGAVLLSDRALDILDEERIRPEHFRQRTERLVFEAMLELRDGGEPVDALTVKARLNGEPVDVDVLAAAVPAVGNLRGYCRIVRDEGWLDSARHSLLLAGDALERRDRDGLLAALVGIDAPTVQAERQDTAGVFFDWYNSEEKGIPLPFHTLTEAVGGGLAPGEVTMLAGWPSHGKTILAGMMLLEACRAGARVHEYANEAVGPRRTARLLSRLTGIPASRMRRRALNENELQRVMEQLGRLPYETTATAGWQAVDYARELRRRRWDLAVIDTVTRIPARDTAEWDRVSGMLADAAAQTGVHTVLVSQLNLARDTGAVRPAPTGRDLRNTGAWYQDARNVLFIHREQEIVDGVPKVLSDGHVRVDKATHGEGEETFVNVTLNPRWMRFELLDSYRSEAIP